ncbi:hypothetical protein CDD80_2967 [Ophiocordyceps camponoti-rufipedis]|uniref:Uncharacterized protein n=1 Tax=Ophiocordyceps camponoti-rufipedis TaxID=2004952 RepID=A0A2C5YYG5_9HYPO|nr:hypothetical protein CDD80_2967 [Ophiocordyceps camponoti-rufipedis]
MTASTKTAAKAERIKQSSGPESTDGEVSSKIRETLYTTNSRADNLHITPFPSRSPPKMQPAGCGNKPVSMAPNLSKCRCVDPTHWMTAAASYCMDFPYSRSRLVPYPGLMIFTATSASLCGARDLLHASSLVRLAAYTQDLPMHTKPKQYIPALYIRDPLQKM